MLPENGSDQVAVRRERVEGEVGRMSLANSSRPDYTSLDGLELSRKKENEHVGAKFPVESELLHLTKRTWTI